MTDIWGYPPTSGYVAGSDLTGYRVDATDGHIGKVDKHSDEVGSASIMVDIGVWIFGTRVLLPVGTITRIDSDERTIYVNRTKDQIKASPEIARAEHTADADYHQQIGTYYRGPII